MLVTRQDSISSASVRCCKLLHINISPQGACQGTAAQDVTMQRYRWNPSIHLMVWSCLLKHDLLHEQGYAVLVAILLPPVMPGPILAPLLCRHKSWWVPLDMYWLFMSHIMCRMQKSRHEHNAFKHLTQSSKLTLLGILHKLQQPSKPITLRQGNCFLSM